MSKALLFKTNSMKDLMRAIKLGVWAKRENGGLCNGIAGNPILFQYKQDYYIAGIYTQINPNLTINVLEVNSDWDGKEKSNSQYEFVPFKDLTCIPKKEFETQFPTERTAKKNTKDQTYSTRFNHYIPLDGDKLVKLLSLAS
jgi:hypothetical protein